MPTLDIEGLKTDVGNINYQAKSYLHNFADIESKRYTVTSDYLSSVVSSIVTNLKHIFVVLNRNANDVKSVRKLVDELSISDVDKFNSVMIQVKDTSDAMIGILENYFATGNKVATDLQLNAMNLNESVSKLVSVLSGKELGIVIEENQDLDTVKADDIEMGQLFLAYDESRKGIKLGICRLMTLTMKGKSISQNEDGSDLILASNSTYLDPSRFVPEEIVNAVNYLYDYEVNSEESVVSESAKETINQVLDFAVNVLDTDEIMKAIEYKKKYSNL